MLEKFDFLNDLSVMAIKRNTNIIAKTFNSDYAIEFPNISLMLGS